MFEYRKVSETLIAFPNSKIKVNMLEKWEILVRMGQRKIVKNEF